MSDTSDDQDESTADGTREDSGNDTGSEPTGVKDLQEQTEEHAVVRDHRRDRTIDVDAGGRATG